MGYTIIDVGVIVPNSQPQPSLHCEGKLGWQLRPNQHQALVVRDILATQIIFLCNQLVI